MLEQKNGQNLGKTSPAVRIIYRNRLSVVKLVGKDRLLLTRVENGVRRDKNIVEKNMPFWPKKFKKTY